MKLYIALAETFFAPRFGTLRDRFGTWWTIIHERPRPQPSRGADLKGQPKGPRYGKRNFLTQHLPEAADFFAVKTK